MTKPKNCNYDFSGENLTALWTEFQKQGAATCPQTGAAIKFENKADSETSEPAVKLHCEGCGREASFEPGKHESFGWAE